MQNNHPVQFLTFMTCKAEQFTVIYLVQLSPSASIRLRGKCHESPPTLEPLFILCGSKFVTCWSEMCKMIPAKSGESFLKCTLNLNCAQHFYHTFTEPCMNVHRGLPFMTVTGRSNRYPTGQVTFLNRRSICQNPIEQKLTEHCHGQITYAVILKAYRWNWKVEKATKDLYQPLQITYVKIQKTYTFGRVSTCQHVQKTI